MYQKPKVIYFLRFGYGRIFFGGGLCVPAEGIRSLVVLMTIVTRTQVSHLKPGLVEGISSNGAGHNCLKLPIEGSKFVQFSIDRLNFNPCMGTEVVQKYIYWSIFVQPLCWKISFQLVLLAALIGGFWRQGSLRRQNRKTQRKGFLLPPQMHGGGNRLFLFNLLWIWGNFLWHPAVCLWEEVKDNMQMFSCMEWMILGTVWFRI